jgi:hypothetical protein
MSYFFGVRVSNDWEWLFLRDLKEKLPSLPPFLPEDGSRASFRSVVFKEKHWTMDKVQKQDSSKLIPSIHPSETSFYLYDAILYSITKGWVIFDYHVGNSKWKTFINEKY